VFFLSWTISEVVSIEEQSQRLDGRFESTISHAANGRNCVSNTDYTMGRTVGHGPYLSTLDQRRTLQEWSDATIHRIVRDQCRGLC
jgi:hypothetical protein